jgi:hypothetical protein
MYSLNFFLVMGRSGFPLSSITALGASLQFLTRVWSFLKVDKLNFVAVNDTPLYYNFGGSTQGA